TGVKSYGLTNDFLATGPGVDYASQSSRRWKTNIQNISHSLEKIKNLRGVTFTWDEEHGGHDDIGFIAEEVAGVLPEIVVYSQDGLHVDGLDYSKTAPLIVEALNELIRDYESKISHLEHMMAQQANEI